jgi:hypothetical protein
MPITEKKDISCIITDDVVMEAIHRYDRDESMNSQQDHAMTIAISQHVV